MIQGRSCTRCRCRRQTDESERTRRGRWLATRSEAAWIKPQRWSCGSPESTNWKSTGGWGLRLAFMQEKDPLTAVRNLVEAQPECRLYRLGGTPALMRRQFVWRVLEHLVDGIAADAMPLGSARQDNVLLTGLLEAVPGALVCAPLTARFQPMAAVLMTSSGAEVAMLAYGSGFVRMPRMDPWPVGVGRPSLTGPRNGIYQVGLSELPINHAATLCSRRSPERTSCYAGSPIQRSSPGRTAAWTEMSR